jgi:hypothetical protein
MEASNSDHYYYLVEWDDTVHRPPYTVIHGINLNPGVEREEFEIFMAEQGFQMVGNITTRAGAVAAQYLLTDVTGDPPKRFEDLDFSLECFGQRASITKFRLVSSWNRMEEEHKPTS